MKILVTFAVRAEFAPWQRRRNFLRLPGEWPVFEAMFGGAQVRAVLTGMGQEHALSAAKRSLAYRPELCISTGLAGSLRSGYRPGDILAARLVSEVGEPVAVAAGASTLPWLAGWRRGEEFAVVADTHHDLDVQIGQSDGELDRVETGVEGEQRRCQRLQPW